MQEGIRWSVLLLFFGRRVLSEVLLLDHSISSPSLYIYYNGFPLPIQNFTHRNIRRAGKGLLVFCVRPVPNV
jgi:hypothetical protein